MSAQETYDIEIAGLKRSLRLFEIKPGLKIAILNILGDTDLVQACAKALNKKLKDVKYDVIVTAEAKSIPLAYALSVESKRPYIILRKSYKPYMDLIGYDCDDWTLSPEPIIEPDFSSAYIKRLVRQNTVNTIRSFKDFVLRPFVKQS